MLINPLNLAKIIGCYCEKELLGRFDLWSIGSFDRTNLGINNTKNL